MAILLVAVIYAAFISLGLPDSLLGSAWPVMQVELGRALSDAGIVSTIISAGTIVSSLQSDRVNRKLGTGKVTAISVLTTAVALLGFSVSTAFWQLCLWAIPFGLGAGAVDAALNNYVALHYTSRHMSWLHCFWGVGATISPYVMGGCLTLGLGWRMGYRTVGLLQVGLTVVLLVSLPLWKKTVSSTEEPAAPSLPLTKLVALPGAKQIFIAFLAHCALEHTNALWTSSYLVQYRGVDVETAARFAALSYIGLTFGRFLCGFVADKLGDRRLIRMGLSMMILGLALVILPLPTEVALAGLLILGFGCAPIYPSIIHSTPANFGRELSQQVIGVEMASAYVGTTVMPPLFGLLAQHISIGLFPVFQLTMTLAVLGMSEWMNRIVSHRT